MEKREFKDRLFGLFAEVGKAVSSPKRVELLDLLGQAERTVEWLAHATGMSMGNTSQHLQVLRAAGLVVSRKEGLYVHYQLSSPLVSEVLGGLRALAEETSSDVDRLVIAYFGDRRDCDAMDMAELLARAEDRGLVLIDVRPPEEYAAAHIAFARSVPLDELDRADLPRDRVVVAYCRGPYCVLADEAVRRLRAAGIDARRLDGGLPEWRSAGHPVVSENAP